ncbi:hypothetical protein MP638_006834 [Amoeboaphelidium occidentale]|nr:hypothetical protein MP638_006834 [Amoeboaphelidium occidentale]
MNFEELQTSVLSTGASAEERVEVNQRHLIDKILARYSSQFTVFRELIQNANDAGATHVDVSFNGQSSSEISEIVVRNNGRVFSDEDWNRLRKIAEGNPDVDKIGFFGVGFYSLFSVCEAPFIVSGGKCMAFYWKGDQLFTRRADAPAKAPENDNQQEWTVFYMKLRDNMELPDIDAFCRFLAMSVSLTENLQNVRVVSKVGQDASEDMLVQIKKKLSPLSDINVLDGALSSLRNKDSPNRLFKLKDAKEAYLHLNITKVKTTQTVVETFKSFVSGFFGAPKKRIEEKKDKEYETVDAFMRYVSATIAVSVPQQFAKEMVRTTKKMPPSTTRIQLLFSSFEEYQTSLQLSSGSSGSLKSLFDELCPHPNQGKVYIGFATHQTTGFSGHLMAHLIPTVERENIDFVDKTLDIWNREILYMAGFVTRIVYEECFAEISRQQNLKGSDKHVDENVLQRASHMMNVFSFQQSTPSSLVGELLKEGFLNCLSTKASVLTQRHGVLPSSDVRMHDETLARFAKQIPLLPSFIVERSKNFVDILHKNQGCLKNITVTDVISYELANRVLEVDELIELLKWWIGIQNRNQVSMKDAENFYELTLVPGCGMDKIPVKLSEIMFYTNPRLITPGMPLPLNTLPYEISKALQTQDLMNILEMEELSISAWTNYVCSLKHFQYQLDFLEKVLEVLSRAFNHIKASEKQAIINILKNMKCIPVEEKKLMVPGETYFSAVTLFSDLPHVSFESKNISEGFLKAIGVRTHVELQIIFDRLHQELGWDIFQLVKYLASVQDKLSAVEWQRLEKSKIFRAENGQKAEMRYTASDLYAPLDSLRSLGSILLLEWPKGKWKTGSDEAKLLAKLGLRSAIPLVDLLKMVNVASSSENRKQLLQYFVDNFDAHYSSEYRPQRIPFPFLPCESSKGEQLFAPRECFLDSQASVLGFPILKKEWHQFADKLGVRRSPPAEVCVSRLLNEPPAISEAEKVFCYMANRSSELSKEDWYALSVSEFIPVEQTIQGKTEKAYYYAMPSKVYFKQENDLDNTLFATIDFKTGNPFLRACGVKDEPNPINTAEEIMKDPRGFLKGCGSVDRYLAYLRQIAVHFDIIQSQTPKIASSMVSIPFLVAQKFKASSNDEMEYDLMIAKDIVIVDDTMLRRLFNPSCCPLENVLEEFYSKLGSRNLSQFVSESFETRGQAEFTTQAKSLHELLKERAPLIISEYGSNRKISKSRSSKLKKEELLNLSVRQVDSIEVTRTLDGKSVTETTTACLKSLVSKESDTSQCLLVTGQFDFFDVAQIITKHYFEQSKLSDALLVSTLLSTSLENLKRKGFAVDRLIVKRQDFEKSRPSKSLEMSLHAPEKKEGPEELLGLLTSMFPNCKDDHIKQLISQNSNADWICDQLLKGDYPKKEAIQKKAGEVVGTSPSLNSRRKSILETIGVKKQQPSFFDGVSPQTTSTVAKASSLMPEFASQQANMLKSELMRAVESCGPNSLQAFKSQGQVSVTARDLSGDLDIVSTAKDMKRAGVISLNVISDYRTVKTIQIPLYYSKTVRDQEVKALLYGSSTGNNSHPMALNAFASILANLADIFGLSMNSIHIFVDGIYDHTSTAVAFNAGGSLFFNYRYFILMHLNMLAKLNLAGSPVTSYTDPRLLQDTSNTLVDISKLPQQPFYYWYLVYCHELAHQFVSAHDSNHEHFLSAFAETYMSQFMFMLLNAGS